MNIINPEQAAAIMGSDFHGPEALAKYFGIELSAEDKRRFATVPFSASQLESCLGTHILVACGALSLADVWNKQPQMFSSHGNPWYIEPSYQHPASPGWQLVRKEPVPNSFGKTWPEQLELLFWDEQVPSISVLSQTVIIHYRETDEQILENVYARVEDVNLNGHHMYLRNFAGRGGIIILYYWNSQGSEVIGLASAVSPAAVG